jgi:MFS family permease
MHVRLLAVPARARWLCVAWMSASLADWFVLWAVLWSAGLLSWSGAQIAGVLLAARGPALVGGLLGGIGIDRIGPRRMLVLDGCCRTLVAAGLVANGLWNGFGYVVALLLIAVAGTAAPISYAAARTFMPRMVPDADLGTGNTLLALGSAMPLVLSAGLVGPALTWFGLAWSFAIPGLLMLAVAVIAARRLGDDAAGGVTDAPEEVQSALGGVAAPGPSPRLRLRAVPRAAPALLGLSTAYYFCFGPFDPALPLIVRDQLGADVTTYGLLWSLSGAGSLVGLLAAPPLCRSSRPAVVNTVLVALNGLAMVLVALGGTLFAAALGCVAIGLLWTPYAAVEATALHRLTPPRLHGRVFGIQRALVISALPIGAAIGAVAQDRLGAPTTLAWAAVASILVAGGALALPAIRARVLVTSAYAALSPNAARRDGA